MVAPNTRDLFKGKILKNYPFRNSQSKALKGIRSSFMQEEAFRCSDQGAFSLVYYITWPYNVTATQRHGWLWVWPSLNRWYAYILVILVIVMLIRNGSCPFSNEYNGFHEVHTHEWMSSSQVLISLIRPSFQLCFIGSNADSGSSQFGFLWT